jgi:hypothetical protein
MEEKQYRFGKQFKAVAATSSGKGGSRGGLMSRCSVVNLYMACAISSFFFLALFGALAIRIKSMCLVQGWVGRCCHCWTPQDPTDFLNRVKGQFMPMHVIYNDLFYGLVMVVNSLFGIYYVYSGVRSENKYLLSIMVVTQLLENGRGLLDVISEQLEEGRGLAIQAATGIDLDEAPLGLIQAREAIIGISFILMFCGFAFLRPMYKKFGWRIFRRGGAKRQIREMYKTFQRYRACNLLDIQSSFLLFIIYVMYLEIVTWNYYWVIFVMFISDVLASRAMVMFMKQENPRGFALCIVAKLSVIIWWVCVIVTYVDCFLRYRDSRYDTIPFFERIKEEDWVRAPDLLSVYNSYNGLSCIRSITSHDSRTMELVAMNFAQALIFRIISFFLAYRVYRNFGQGLVEVFYKGVAPKEVNEKAENLVEEDEPNSDDGKWTEEAEEGDETSMNNLQEDS